jgi:hypothetical protein
MDSALFVRHAELCESMELERVEDVRRAKRSASSWLWSGAGDHVHSWELAAVWVGFGLKT